MTDRQLLKSIASNLGTLAKDFSSFKAEMTEFRDRTTAKLDDLQSQVNTLTADFSAFKSEMTEFKSEMTEFKSEMTGFKSEMTGFKSEMLEFRDSVNKTLGHLQLQVDVLADKFFIENSNTLQEIQDIQRSFFEAYGEHGIELIRIKRRLRGKQQPQDKAS